MEKEPLLEVRNTIKGDDDYPLDVYYDNIMKQSEVTDWIFWNDNKGVLYRVGASSNHITNQKAPIEIFGTEYYHVQYLVAQMSVERFHKFAQGIRHLGLSEKVEKEIVRRLSPSIDKFVPAPGYGQTMKDVR